MKVIVLCPIVKLIEAVYIVWNTVIIELLIVTSINRTASDKGHRLSSTNPRLITKGEKAGGK